MLRVVKLTHNVHAFVLLGTSSIRRRRRRQPTVVTKDKILFFQPPKLRSFSNLSLLGAKAAVAK